MHDILKQKSVQRKGLFSMTVQKVLFYGIYNGSANN